MAEANVQRAKVIPPSPAPPRGFPRLGDPMPEHYVMDLARAVARTEIKAVARELAAQVHKGVQQSFDPFSQKIAEMGQHIDTIHLHLVGLISLLEAKGVLTRDEVSEAAKRVKNTMEAREKARQELLKKALQEKAQAEVAKQAAQAADGGAGPAPVAPVEGAPAAGGGGDGATAGAE